MPLLSEADLRRLVGRLAAISRGSASPGEREAAELIAEDLRGAGARARTEEEPAHGTYWWPLGLLMGASALAGVAHGRLWGLVGAGAAAAAADDITAGSLWFRRRFLPMRNTVNVVAEVGPADAERAAVFVAHHDAAHSGLVFHPALPRAFARRFPKLHERTNTTPPAMWGVVGGPLAVALGALTGSRRLRGIGTFLCAGYAAAMVDIGTRGVVPGANDNLTGVAVLSSLAHALRDSPPANLRVILVSTGSEESFMEGMQGFAKRHFGSLPTDRTHVVCVDSVGSPHLVVLEGEGMLRMNEYPKDLLGLLKGLADELDLFLYPNLRLRNATDGLVALKAGYPTAALTSVDELKAPSNYHWPTDTAENVLYGTVNDAARLCESLVRALARAG